MQSYLLPKSKFTKTNHPRKLHAKVINHTTLRRSVPESQGQRDEAAASCHDTTSGLPEG